MATDTHEREWLAPKEVAHELRVHVSAVYRAVERGHLPAVRLSETGAIRIHHSVLEREHVAAANPERSSSSRPARAPGPSDAA